MSRVATVRKPKIYKATKTSPKKFLLLMKFNGGEYKILTDDLADGIMSVAPRWLKTKIIFRIETDGKYCDKQVFVLQGKMIFRNKLNLNIFVRNCIFK